MGVYVLWTEERATHCTKKRSNSWNTFGRSYKLNMQGQSPISLSRKKKQMTAR